MEILVKTLDATCGFSPQDGNILDFRNQGVQLFIIDKNNILKPGKNYKVDISLVHEYIDENIIEDTIEVVPETVLTETINDNEPSSDIE